MEYARFVRLGIIGSIFLLFSWEFVAGQSLVSPSSSFSEQTAYPVFAEKDLIYYFCGTSGQQNGTLKAKSLSEIVTFTWEKFNTVTGTFSFFSNETGITSLLSGLGDGCYRVRFSESGKAYTFRAWVMNSWLTPTSAITESNCQSFKLQGGAAGSNFSYSDLSTNQLVTINPGYKYIWYADNLPIAAIQNPLILEPPTKNTVYRLEVTNRAGCMGYSEVTYQSIVVKAKFSWKTDQKSDAQFTNYEAPLPVQFINESENADVDKYECMLFK